jgi:hypothetical protein
MIRLLLWRWTNAAEVGGGVGAGTWVTTYRRRRR